MNTSVQTPLVVKPFIQCETLADAYAWANNTANSLLRNGESVVLSRIAADRFKKPRSRQIQIIGVSAKAGKEAAKLAPYGKWWIEHDTDQCGNHQFMAWYSRYLPYAYAMMCCEDGFEAMGIDYESINSYFRSCMGFVFLGTGDVQPRLTCDNPLAVLARGENIEDYRKFGDYFAIFRSEDVDLYNDIYRASAEVSPPGLPWDEAWRPAYCFVAFQRPELFVRYIQFHGRDKAESMEDHRTKHVLAVAEYLGKPAPAFKWK